ncbi:hypothetical protein BV20DRAFT_781460 [Pilatotrama ljubarskyi]|nr:hypothetical protein BV20DRAFT_781460 [Pilatotrama ljubarskyi]
MWYALTVSLRVTLDSLCRAWTLTDVHFHRGHVRHLVDPLTREDLQARTRFALERAKASCPILSTRVKSVSFMKRYTRYNLQA